MELYRGRSGIGVSIPYGVSPVVKASLRVQRTGRSTFRGAKKENCGAVGMRSKTEVTGSALGSSGGAETLSSALDVESQAGSLVKLVVNIYRPGYTSGWDKPSVGT